MIENSFYHCNSRMSPTSIITLLGYLWGILLLAIASDAKIGINWGKGTNLVPSMVVDLLMQNNVSNVKLYNIRDEIISAFGGTGIGVTIDIVVGESIQSVQDAKDFITEKIAPHPDVDIKYVQLGTNPLTYARMKKVPFSNIIDRFRMIQTALDELGYGNRIKACMTHSISGVITLFNAKPSDAAFLPDVMQAMLDYLAIINTTNVPFMLDYFPIAYTRSYNLDPNFGFFDNKSTYSVTDVNGFVYTNVFDFVYDCAAWSLKKVGYGNIPIIVSQIGWPTDGVQDASVETAERFYKGLIPRVLSNIGTPMRPGAPIDIYIHSLSDEKRIPAYVPFVRHWGIYRSNGEPKYKIDLTGKGRDIFPTTAKGISLMPSRWCVFNNDTSDKQKVDEQFSWACKNADCTSLEPGASCGMLTAMENVSYAFNAYFQANYQDENTCKFQGLGRMVVENPSRNGCVFIVEVVKGKTKPILPSRWG